MSEAKFTKGGWTRNISANGCNYVKCDRRRNNGYNIASTYGSDKIANAHLIASAPAMYAMLNKLIQPYGMEDFSYDEVEQLLAKARGES